MEPIRSYKLAVILALFFSSLAHAFPRTYVSVNGNDSNTTIGCPVTAPCRSFGAALGVTNPFGEIVAADTGDYAPVTVTQSVTIQAAPGVDATVIGNAIQVTVGASDIVILRGLNVNGLNSPAPSGIRFTAGGTLIIENCSITSFMLSGISIEAGGTVHIKDSEVENTVYGIRLQSPSGLIQASIDGVHLKNNMTGLFAAQNSQATLRRSVLANNRNNGISAGDFSGTSEVNVEDCLIQGSNTGIFAANGGGGGTALVRVSHSSILDNSIGLSSSGAPLLSYGNNRLAGNGFNGSFTGLIALQ